MLDIKKLLTKILTMGVFKDASGNVSISGNITVGGHAGRIGGLTTIYKTESIASSTSWQTISDCKLSLSAGSWIIQAHAIFDANSTGIRGVRIMQAGSALAPSPQRMPTLTGNYQTDITTVVSVQTSNTYEYAVSVFQNSGSSLSVTGYLRAMRIS